MAKVVATHCDESILGENGEVDFAKANLVTFAGKKYFASNKEIEKRGCGIEICEKK